jgi:enoyl-CoA hydratase
MTDRYAAFDRLKFDRPAPHVLRLTLSNPGKANAVTPTMHRQLEEVWAAIDADPRHPGDDHHRGGPRVLRRRGAGRHAGGRSPLDPTSMFSQDFNNATRLVAASSPRASRSSPPSTARPSARAWRWPCWPTCRSRPRRQAAGRPPVRIGVAPGDHAAIVWPLLCGMAKAKYYLMTNRP